MSHQEIVRAWKDEDYRLNLREVERAMVPESPVGTILLADANLTGATGSNKGKIFPVSLNLHCTSSRFTPCCY
jgi:mersacidin/lichenicidin family type 2 lantibiotic